MGVMAFFFLLQTQPFFCACQSEGTASAAMASSTMPMNNGMPMKGCPCKGKDSDPHKADQHPCPVCHGLNTCSPEEMHKVFAVSPVHSFTGSILPVTSSAPTCFLARVQFIPDQGLWSGTQHKAPIHLLKSSFLF